MIQSTATVATPEAIDNADEERLIPLEQIARSPFNTRSDFDPAELQKLADSLIEHGQMQNIVVRPRKLVDRLSREDDEDGPRYELIAGERRWHAAQAAGLSALRAKIIHVDDATAIELTGIENFQRQQLNDIEQARWFQAMVDEAGYTQTKLAERLGITQGQVSQRLALLSLPKDWQAAIITGVIPFTWARELAPWADYPQVLQKLRKVIGKNPAASLGHFRDMLNHSINCCSRPLGRGYGRWQDAKGNWVWREIAFTPTKKQRADLQIEKVKPSNGGAASNRAFNIELWNDLQAAGEKRRAEREAKKRETESKKPAKATAAEKAQLKKTQAEQLARRIKEWRIHWLQQRIAEQFREGAVLLPTKLRILLHQCCVNGAFWRGEAMDRVIAELKIKPGKKTGFFELWDYLAAASAQDLDEIIDRVLESWVLQLGGNGPINFDDDEIEAIADELDIDLAAEWELTRDYLELHNIEQLKALIKEWKLAKHKISGKRSEIIDGILAAPGKRAAPKALVQAKGGR